MSTTSPTYTLYLAKEDFKFSSAHFTLFVDEEAELFHGHNYRVRLDIRGDSLDEQGLLADIYKIKKELRALCASLDSFTLIPEESSSLDVEQSEHSVSIRYKDRYYQLPRRDVVMMPLANTSIELLAHWFWHQLAARLDMPRVKEMAVDVEETAGQSCTYRAPYSS